MLRIGISLVLVLLLIQEQFAQTVYGGSFPELAVSIPTAGPKLTFKTEAQLIHFDNREDPEQSNWKATHYRTDFQAFAGTKLNPLTQLAFGYHTRWEDSPSLVFHRFIQQLTFLQSLHHVRLAHRIRTDQTIEDRTLAGRIRYRLSMEWPLSGQSIDPGEAYFILSKEELGGFSMDGFGYESRLVLTYGFLLPKNIKLEFGPDWRVDRFGQGDLRSRIWFNVGCFIQLKGQS